MSDQAPGVARTQWLCQPLSSEVERSLERLAGSPDVCRLAVMPDVHLASDVCVGVVTATRRLIYPGAIGGDIGCGMAALAFDADAALLANERSAARLLAGLYRRIPTMRHEAASAPSQLPGPLREQALSHPRLEKLKGRDGRVQLGTLGRGNHFLEFQVDDDGRLWMMVHSGSRAMGQAITSHHVAVANSIAPAAESSSSGRLCSLASDTEQGAAYLTDLGWAREYARLNRLAMVEAAAELLASLFAIHTDWSSLIHSDHNHVRRETHDGEELWVHRKGALSAYDDEPGVIPGSMGSASFHVAGRGHAAALCSSSHGAGRTLSRSEAARTISVKRFQKQMEGVWFDHRQAVRLRDEAPSAYKDIRAVMRAQRDLTRIVRELQPLLSYKGG